MAEEETPSGEQFTQAQLELLLKNNQARERYNELIDQGKTQQQALNALIDAGLTLLSRSIDHLQKQKTLLESQLLTETDLQTKIRLNNELRESEIRIGQQLVRQQSELLTSERERTPEAIQRLKTLQDGVAALRRQKEAVATVDSSSRQLLKTLTGISKSHQQSLSYATLMGGKEGFGQLALTLRDTVASAEGLSNVLGSTLQKIQEMTLGAVKSMSSLNAQYAQQTGLVADNTYQLTKNWRALTDQAASLEEVNEARTALATGAARFVHMHEAERNKLIQLGTTLKQVGVSMSDFTETVNLLQVGFQMNTNEVIAFENRLFELGQNVGFSTMQIQRDWAQSQNVLAKYGRQSEDVFAGLEMASKNTGLGINQLIGITDQFVTFEGAADIVGKFNAMLGGPYLNTIQMVYASDEKRLQLLRDVFKQSGKNWQQMSDQERMMYAWSAGIKDMKVAAQLWGTTDKDFKKVRKEQQTMADLALKSKDIFQKFQESMMRLAAAAEPLVNALSKVVDFLAKIMPETMGGSIALFGTLSVAYVTNTMRMRHLTVAAMQNMAAMQTQATITNLVVLAKGREISVLNADTLATNRNTAARSRNAAAGRGMGGGMMGRLGTGATAGLIGYGLGASLASIGASGRKSEEQRRRSSLWSKVGAGALAGGAIGAGAGAGIFSIPGAAIGAGIGAVGGGIAHMATYTPAMEPGGKVGPGAVIVGDSKSKNLKGAEIVTSKGASVVSAKETSEIIGASQINREAMDNLVAAINRLTVKMDSLRQSQAAGAAKGFSAGAFAPVTLSLNGATLASAVINLLRDRHEVGITG